MVRPNSSGAKSRELGLLSLFPLPPLRKGLVPGLSQALTNFLLKFLLLVYNFVFIVHICLEWVLEVYSSLDLRLSFRFYNG